MTVDFQNFEQAFIAKTDGELYRAYQLFNLMGNQLLNKVLTTATRVSFSIGLPIGPLVRITVFDQFCGGIHLRDCDEAVSKLGSYAVSTCLDYSVEAKKTNDGFDKTVEELIRMVEYANRNSHVSFVVIKPTAIAPLPLMEKMSKNQSLNIVERADWDRVKSRLEKVADVVSNNKQRLFIDAEDSWYQPCVDQFAIELMQEYNKKSATVFNTLQFYRWDRLEYLLKLIDRARSEGFILGLKNVRGAYLEKERSRATIRGYSSPIQNDKESTDRDYDLAISTCMDNLDVVNFCAATHNADSLHKLIALMREKELKNNDGRIWMSQLYGMGDNLSFNLAAEGYNVCKYLPYGPLNDVIPYLTRRAEENSSIAGQMGREQTMIYQEMCRRGLV